MADQTCSVCLGQFGEPKILPCCHTFCLKCLERTARTKAEITCPICRKTHAIPAGGLQEFLTDFIVSHEVEVAGLKSPSAAMAPVCGECEEEGPVDSYCCDCQAYLCSECSTQAHKKLKSYRGHKVIPVQDLDVASLQSSIAHYCSTHSREVVKLYCETCSKLICRDCTLVDHRQHSYMFVQDARKQISDLLMSAVKNGKQKRAAFKANLGEIQRVETTATTYPEVCKADINAFFDTAIQSLERRRQQLLSQADAECQKDLKQIWADKIFHQTTISQFDAALGLASKASKCNSDVEMILTALQSIRQLLQLKEIKWDADAFAAVASLPGKFTEGTKLEANKTGCFGRARALPSDVMVQNLPTTAELGQTIAFKITRMLRDGRSKQKINLRNTSETNVQVIVNYGHAQKSHEEVSVSRAPQSDVSYIVTLRLICGGKHTIKVEVNAKPVNGSPFSLDVTGTPEVGARVRHGPDWKEQRRGVGGMAARRDQFRHNQVPRPVNVPNMDANEEGTVQRVYEYAAQNMFAPQPQFGLHQQATATTTTVRVNWDSGYTSKHTWGGPYEIELV